MVQTSNSVNKRYVFVQGVLIGSLDCQLSTVVGQSDYYGFNFITQLKTALSTFTNTTSCKLHLIHVPCLIMLIGLQVELFSVTERNVLISNKLLNLAFVLAVFSINVPNLCTLIVFPLKKMPGINPDAQCLPHVDMLTISLCNHLTCTFNASCASFCIQFVEQRCC